MIKIGDVIVVVLLLFAFGLVAFFIIPSPDTRRGQVKIYPKVERVFMHKPGQFSFMVLEDGELKTMGGDYEYHYKLIEDVPSDQPMWAKISNEPNSYTPYCDIHVHSSADIGGGGYRVGKSGTGQTTPLEN